MFWQVDDNQTERQVPDNVVDILFSLDCKRLPVDHAYALSAALRHAVPWVADGGAGIAVHTVHVAGSQNGWERPDHGAGQLLIPSRRTKLTIRAPRERADSLVIDLQGKTLNVDGYPLTVGPARIRGLSKEKTLFSRYVVCPAEAAIDSGHDVSAHPHGEAHDPETAFLEWAARELQQLGIRIRKAMCGKATALGTPAGKLPTRSLLVADLTPKESLALQQEGLGPGREMGCGIFIPHKGIEAVGKAR